MKSSSFTTCLGIFLFFFSLTSAQMNKKVDSLTAIYSSLPDNEKKIRILSNLYDETEYTDPNLAKTYVDMELKLAKKLNNVKEIGSAYYNLACYYDNKDIRDSVGYFLKKAKEKYVESNYEHGIMITQHFEAVDDFYAGNYDNALKKLATVMATRERRKEYGELAADYGFKAFLYQRKYYYKLALKNYINGLKILDTIKGYENEKAEFLGHMGGLESELGNTQKAIEYVEKSLKLYEELDYAKYEAESKTSLSFYHTNIGDFENAIAYGKEAVKQAKEIGSKQEEHDAYAHLGLAYLKTKDYPKSISYFKQDLEFRRRGNRAPEIMHSLESLGMVYNEINRPDVALTYLNQALKLADSLQNLLSLQTLYNNRADSYEKKNQLAKAIIDYKKSNTIKDSLIKINNNREIEELRTIYETEKKEQQITLQEKEITVLEQQAEISTLQKLLLGIGLLLSLIGFYAIGQKLKRNKLEKEKVDAELAFKKKELTTHALHLAKKNEVLEGLKQKAQELKANEESKKGYQQLIRTINFDLQDDNNWQNFSRYFEEVHKDFNSNVKTKYPQVTSNELRLLALLKMNLSSKEIANILNISPEGIKKARYRLRKKLDITTEDSLQDLVLSL
ncbi:MAG: tetratricopeptide repeat protein [Flavobacteriaceae bacterium]